MNHSASSDLRTKLNKVRGLGPAHHGISHWWLQRLTAVALVPLSAWFMFSLVSVMLTPDVAQVAGWFASPINSIMMVLMLATLFVHAKLGVQVVIEDYVHATVMKYTLLLLNVFVCTAFAVISILAVLKLHFLDIAATM